MHNGINPPKLVIEMVMEHGEAKPQNVNREVVRKILMEYTPSAELRTSAVHAIGIEDLPRDTLRVTVAIKKDFAPQSFDHFIATMSAEFARKFAARQAKGYLDTVQR